MKYDEISEFLKVAKQNGRIKDVKEAFKEYPADEEWHKGQIESLLELREEDVEYQIYEVGDIVYVNEYCYDNGEKGKNHLFVIVEQNNLAVPIENFGMLISSKLKKLNYHYNKFLEKDEINGLDKDSIVKTDVIYKISNKQILFKIGKVNKDRIEQYKRSFYENLK